MKKVLVTGGAGYIGSVLVRLLLDNGYSVRVLDNLSFGGEAIVELLNNNNFEFLKGDIRNKDDLKVAMKDIEYVAHLASIVGDPACAVDSEVTKDINLNGAKLTYEVANEMGIKKFVFASTCSNYGKMEDSSEFVNEDSELRPVSLYAETKVGFEQYLLSQDNNNIAKPTCLRFSTVYGLSPRIRFDLTVNEFTKELALERELVIFGEQFWRPYCHVVDLSRGVMAVFDADAKKVAFNVYNVGDTTENYQKQMIVDEIVKQLPKSKVKYVKRNEDPRDYRVSFEKIKNDLDFKITKTVPDGIRDFIKIVQEGFINDPDSSKYKNV
jgi:nucleoside-diphosphate-sugar epimerase